ncbi:hypothetical protein IJS77_03000, partial [bacterium]|nr:hypothetical protein [bacterium]
MLNQIKKEHQKTLTKRDILRSFYSFAPNIQMKIGMELERLPIDRDKLAVKYYGKNGIKELLEEISSVCGWGKLYNNQVLVGLKKGETTITLEPGCQFEISLEPQKSVVELKNRIEKIDEEIQPVLNHFKIKLLEYGISPYSTSKEIEVFPKKRYQYMAKYLPGVLASSMMRETAGIQVAIDFKNEEDAIKKLRIFTKISPVMTAMFANSPIKGGKNTGFKTNRALAWLKTDNARCGLISKKLFDKNYEFRFEDYLDRVLDIPMLYISRPKILSNGHGITCPINNDIIINGKITFREFLQHGYDGFLPIMNDYETQQSLFFPEVRLKNYLEIRNHDCQKGDLKYSIPAIYKGLAYNEQILNSLIELFDEFSYEDVL